MKHINCIFILALSLVVTGCALFKPYSGVREVPDNLFGNEVVAGGEPSADMSWRQFFTDPRLQELIDTALVRNLDLSLATLRVEQAEEALKAARLGFLPSLSFTPSFTAIPGQSYALPLSLGWDNQGLGSIVNRKREAQALASQASDNEQYVRSRLVAAVAKAYAQAQMLDRQLEIMESTEQIWTSVYETQKILMENGKSYSTSVNQMAAALVDVRIQRKDAENQLRQVENSICLMLGKTPQSIVRSAWGEYSLPSSIGTGVPASILENRPDVRAAGRSVEAAYYVSRQALGAMFPSLSLSGMFGWATDGSAISDPAKMVYNAVVSLAQPVFARGQLRSAYKISSLQQEEAAKNYAQALIAAGNEVNNALRACQLAEEKDSLYKEQTELLQDAYSATRELMANGKASYIEVLTAQDNLLKAQLGEAANLYEGCIGLIDLYTSLGGGVR